ncbi:MAG: FHA domain-containing protein [Xenococcaceae cyanobacterium MO_234.B1]|nr:FHA domain-containing protein [Xenococcaceae cyanobacterium MO_234.B1]
MIVCPNCNHQNPEGSIQCESCYSPLPFSATCPNCGTAVQTDAMFCGQCGFNLQGDKAAKQDEVSINPFSLVEENTDNLPLENTIPTAVGNTPMPSPWNEETKDITFAQNILADDTEIMNPSPSSFVSETPWKLEIPKTEKTSWEISDSESSSEISELSDMNKSELESAELPEIETPDSDASAAIAELPEIETPDSDASTPIAELPEIETPDSDASVAIAELPEIETPDSDASTPIAELPEIETPDSDASAAIAELSEIEMEIPDIGVASEGLGAVTASEASEISSATQLQIQQANLFHVQTSTTVEIPQDLDVIHIGKSNSQIPPDIDISGFPNSEIVSRIHADIRVEGDTYFIEDVGSSNGTYINHIPLLRGNRYRLRTGDRISLGKGDLVTFIFHVK